jgi:tRNA(Ile)-lysidine synthase
MVRLRRLFHLELACFHFDHALREGSKRDATYVRGQAQRLGIPVFERRASSRPARGESVEAWARTVRYAALKEVLEELGGGVAAVAHTADDQAETVLLALLRGGGLEALTGMQPVARPIIRPLLDVTREETVAFCRALGLRPRRDPMNEDPRFMRVSIRTRVIPEIERGLGRGVRGTLVRTAALLRQDAEFLEGLAVEAVAGVVEAHPSGAMLLRADRLAALPPAVSSRVVRRLLLGLGVAAEAAHVQAILDLAAGRGGRTASLPGGLRGRRAGEYVRFSRSSPGPRSTAPPPATP